MLADYLGFKNVITILASLMATISFAFPFVFSNSFMYFVIVVLSSFSCSATYTLVLLQSGKIFGSKVGSKVYGYGVIGIGTSTISVGIIMEFKKFLGYQGICFVICFITLLAILVAQISS